MKYAEIPPGWSQVEYEVGDSLEEQSPASQDATDPGEVGDSLEEDDGVREYQATWATNEEGVTISVSDELHENEITYPIIVEQFVEADGYRTSMQTHVNIEETIRGVEEQASAFMSEMNDGNHSIEVLGVEEWEEFVQFYCIRDASVPGEMTAEDIIDTIDSADIDDPNVEYDVDNVPDDPTDVFDDVIDVEIYPRHESEVDKL